MVAATLEISAEAPTSLPSASDFFWNLRSKGMDSSLCSPISVGPRFPAPLLLQGMLFAAPGAAAGLQLEDRPLNLFLSSLHLLSYALPPLQHLPHPSINMRASTFVSFAALSLVACVAAAPVPGMFEDIGAALVQANEAQAAQANVVSQQQQAAQVSRPPLCSATRSRLTCLSLSLCRTPPPLRRLRMPRRLPLRLPPTRRPRMTRLPPRRSPPKRWPPRRLPPTRPPLRRLRRRRLPLSRLPRIRLPPTRPPPTKPPPTRPLPSRSSRSP